MNRPSLVAALTALACLAAPHARAQKPVDAAAITKFADPLAEAKPAPKVVTDVTAAPDLKDWADQAAMLARDWFPEVCRLLATEKYRAPKEMKLTFKPGISAPAYAAGHEITINADWIRQHPDDTGIVIHEMTHLIQAYGGRGERPGWLVEGIADYIRWWRFEPESPRTRVDPDKSKYTDAYRTTAAFLAWATARYDRSLVRKLDLSIRDHKYEPAVWEQSTGKSVDALWTEYTDGLRAANARK